MPFLSDCSGVQKPMSNFPNGHATGKFSVLWGARAPNTFCNFLSKKKEFLQIFNFLVKIINFFRQLVDKILIFSKIMYCP